MRGVYGDVNVYTVTKTGAVKLKPIKKLKKGELVRAVKDGRFSYVPVSAIHASHENLYYHEYMSTGDSRPAVIVGTKILPLISVVVLDGKAKVHKILKNGFPVWYSKVKNLKSKGYVYLIELKDDSLAVVLENGFLLKPGKLS